MATKAKHRYVVEVLVVTDAKVTKAAVRKIVEFLLNEWPAESSIETICKSARVRKVDMD